MEIVCEGCGEANPSKANFCLNCGEQLKRASETRVSEQTTVGERRVVSVLFADLSGFTSFSERSDVEEVRALADEAAGRLGDIVQRFGGIVDKIIGDAVMAVFGAPVSHEDDPERAVRSALDMQAYVTKHSEKFARLPLRIGINTGEAMFAPVGPQGQYTVIGDTVNTASRLQSASARGEIWVGNATYVAASDAIDFEEVPPIEAKGKEEPVRAFRAVAVKGAKPVPTRISRGAPLIGRSAEFNRMWELWERVKSERKPYLVSILGQPGLGKSRLITEFTGRCGSAAEVWWGRCLSYGEGITYWPVTELIKQAAGITHDDDAEAVSTKLGDLLENLGTDDLDELRTMAVSLANLVAAPTTPRGTYQAERISRGELHWGIRRLMEHVAAKKPIAIVIEDLHWAEPTLLGLIEFLLGSTEAPIMLITSARPELRDTAPEFVSIQPNRRLIELSALSEGESKALVEELSGELALPEKTIDALMKAAGGNPLYLEEIIRTVADTAMTKGEDPTEAFAVPDSLQSLVGSRLDKLTGPERQVAESASVVGLDFWPGALRYLEERANTAVEEGLEGLESRDIVHEKTASSVAAESEWAFKHILIRDVAYRRLPKARRAALHIRCGEWISSLPGPEDELIEIVAYHLEQACRLIFDVKRSSITPPVLAAANSLLRAGVKAEGREGMSEADRFYTRALQLVENRMPETAMELRLKRARTMTALLGLSEALKEFELVADSAQEVGRPDLRCKALLNLARIEQAQGRASDARSHLDEAASIAGEIDDANLQISAALLVGSFKAQVAGSLEEAFKDLRSAISTAEKKDEQVLMLEGQKLLATLLANAGRLVEAEEALQAGLGLAKQRGDLREEAGITYFLSFVTSYVGEIEEAERLALQSVQWLERTGDGYLQIQNLRSLAKFAMSRGDYTAAEDRLNRALPMATRIGGWLAVEIYRFLAETMSLQGKITETREAAIAARQLLPPEDDGTSTEAATLLSEAFAATVGGNEPSARELFESTIKILEHQEMPIEAGEVRISYARALKGFGDDASARDQLDRARATFEPMGAVAKTVEIERELAGIAA